MPYEEDITIPSLQGENEDPERHSNRLKITKLVNQNRT